jgi:hypothetical protein
MTKPEFALTGFLVFGGHKKHLSRQSSFPAGLIYCQATFFAVGWQRNGRRMPVAALKNF